MTLLEAVRLIKAPAEYGMSVEYGGMNGGMNGGLTAEALAGLKDKKILEIRIDESTMCIILRLADAEIAISPFAPCKC